MNDESSFSETTVDAEQEIVQRARQDELRHRPQKRRDLVLFSGAATEPTAAAPVAKKQRRERVARETEKIAASFESAEEIQRLEQETSAKPQLRAAKQTVIQTSLDDPLPPDLKEKITNPAAKKNKIAPQSTLSAAAAAAAAGTTATATATSQADANRKLTMQAEEKAKTLLLSSLWDHTLFPPSKNTASKARYVWPHYDGRNHDASLVKIDFIIDYLNNMLLIPHEPTTLARQKLILDYETSSAAVMGNLDDYATVNVDEVAHIDLQHVTHTDEPYVFDKSVFGEKSEVTGVRKERVKLAANTDIANALTRPLRKKRKCRSEPPRQELTTSADEDSLSDADSAKKPRPPGMSLAEMCKYLPNSKVIYRPMAATQYELEHPHFMTPIHQRLLIGKLNDLLFVHSNAEMNKFRFDDFACNVFGLDKYNVGSWSQNYITTLGQRMTTYMLCLFNCISRKSREEFIYVYGEKRAKKLHECFYHQRLASIQQQINCLMIFLISQTNGFCAGSIPKILNRPSILTMSVCAPCLNDEGLCADMKPYERIVRRKIEDCLIKGYRRRNGAIYQEVTTKEGYKTNAFERLCDIREYVWQVPDMNFDTKAWRDTLNSGNMQENVEKYLSLAQIPEYFPDVKRQQFVWSFRNGIYDGQQDRFWRYDSPEIESDPESPKQRVESSARYIDLEFNDQFLMSAAAVADPRLIVVEPVKRIFDDQMLSEEVQDWAWAFTGRLYFPNRMLDGWQVAFWMKGVAGTGKSTFATAAKAPYDPSDIGYLPNNVETQFGLEAMLEKLLIVAPDVKANFALDPANFQTMVSGDPMSISRKGRVPVTIHRFETPQLYLSNVFPNWVDSSGSIQRRVMPLLMDYPVPSGKKDGRLEAALLAQLDALVVHACREYKRKLALVGNGDVWHFVPNEFRLAREEVSRETAELYPFFEEFLVLSAPENAETEFVEISDLEVLYQRKVHKLAAEVISGGGMGAKHIPKPIADFSSKCRRDITSFKSLRAKKNEKTLTYVIYGCRLVLENARTLFNNKDWLPKRSAYFDPSQAPSQGPSQAPSQGPAKEATV